MAARTFDESNEERKRELEEARRGLEAAMTRCAAAELACSAGGSPGESAATLDGRLRTLALVAARRGLEAAYGKDGSSPGACPGCGGRPRLLRRERTGTETALGRVEMEMARFACRECGRSWRPREKSLGVEGSMTPSARRLASVAGSETSYAKADELLRELSELNFGAKRIERTTRAAGADFEAWRAASGAEAPPRKRLKPGWTLCCALDGTGVPMSPRETAGRAGKDGDAPSRTREAKVGALWVSERDERGRPRAVAGTTVLFAAVESAAETPGAESPFERRMLRELAAAGWTPRDVGLCLGDGAEWIRRLFDDWFPDARKVVDYYHAAEYLWSAARARHGEGDLAAAWAKKLCGMLGAGRLDDALAELRRRGGDVEECRRAVRYLAERRDRTRYGELRAAGLPIGSGRVEAGCKNIVGRRMKGAGMRWSVAGANPVLQLRCARQSGSFDDYWKAPRLDRLAA